MRTLGTRFPDGCPTGTALTPDGNCKGAAHPPGLPPNTRANRPLLAGTPTNMRQAGGFLPQLNQTQGQPPNRMTSLLSELHPLRECLEGPHHGIDTPVAFPREPQTKPNICPILRPNRGDLTPEEAPEIAATEIVIATTTVPAMAVTEAVRDSNPGGAVQVAAGPGASQNRFL